MVKQYYPVVAAVHKREIGHILAQIGQVAFTETFGQGSDLATAEVLASAREGIPAR